MGNSELCDDGDGGGKEEREMKVTLNQHQVLSRLNHRFICAVLAVLMDRTFLTWIWCFHIGC